MASIGLLAAQSDDREELGLLLGELGHVAEGAGKLSDAVEYARERRPRAFVIVDGGGADAEILTRELMRAFPLLPVVVALKTRDATRAVELMRAGALEVAAPPWTREDLKACVSKSLRGSGTAISPVRIAPRRRSGAWYALAVGLFMATALSVASLKRARAQRAAEAAKVDAWTLPVSHPAGLAFDGQDLQLVDWYSQSLYALSRSDAHVLTEHHLTAETPVAAAYTAENVWTVSADGAVARRMRDAKLTLLQRYPSAALNCAGLAFDGLYLWTLDGRAQTLTKHLLDEALTPVSTTKIPGLKVVALIWDGHALWTLDAGDRVLRRHDLERPELVVSLTGLPEYGDGVYEAKGLAWDGSRFWSVGERRDGHGPAKLTRHRSFEAK
jgi:DNA-binding response OmpR family regulator